MSQAGANKNGGGGGGGTITELTPNSGGPVVPIAGNINIGGIGGNFTRNAGAATMSIDNLRWLTQFVVDANAAPGSDAEFTTVTAAVAAASAAGGGVVFVREGLYTESFTLPAAVGLTAFLSIASVFGSQVGAVIDGTITISQAGENTIENICLINSAGAAVLDFPGANNLLCAIENCFIVQEGAGAAITGSNTNANVLVNNVEVVTAGDFLNSTGFGADFHNCDFRSIGGSPNAIFNGMNARGRFFDCRIEGLIQISNGAGVEVVGCIGQAATVDGASAIDLRFCDFNPQSPGTATLTTTGAGGSLRVFQSALSSQNVEAINLNAATGASIDQSSINVGGGAAFAIAGTGSVQYGLIEFPGSVTALDPGLTFTVFVVRPFPTAGISSGAAQRGLASFNSANFTVDNNGFVSLIGGTGVLWTDHGASVGVLADSGSFATAAITLTLPVAPAQGNTCDFVVDNPGVLIVQASAGQTIRINTGTSSVGGTATSTAQGNTLNLVFRTVDSTWHALSSNGNWTLA